VRILQVAPADGGGGAEDVARRLHDGYRAAGHEAVLLVGRVTAGGEGVAGIRQGGGVWRLVERLERGRRWRPARAARFVAAPRSFVDWAAGREIFRYPGTRRGVLPAAVRADVVQLHNLHGAYFDLRELPNLAARARVVLTPHDMWLATGHCAHTFDCEGWTGDCRPCPYLGTYPALRRDGAAANLRRKAALYAGSPVRLAAPCRWLLDRLARSVIAPALVETRVIPNGIDLTTFSPGSREKARSALGLPADAPVVVFAGRAARSSPWRDFGLFVEAVSRSGAIGLVVGGEGGDADAGRGRLRFLGDVSAGRFASVLRAADLCVHAARADTFPTTVLESLACGTPVVATPVGGIPEQVRDGETGMLAAPADLPAAVVRLLADGELRARLGERAAADALRRFDVRDQVAAYLDWFAAFPDDSSTLGACRPSPAG